MSLSKPNSHFDKLNVTAKMEYATLFNISVFLIPHLFIMGDVISQNRVRQVFFIILILLLGILLFFELSSFLPALLGAITLYVLLHRWMFYLTEKKKWRKGLTALLLMLFSFIVILLPVGLLVNMLSSKVSYAIQHSAELTEALKKLVADLEQRFDVVIASDQNINKLGNSITQSLPKILGATFNTFSSLSGMYSNNVFSIFRPFISIK